MVFRQLGPDPDRGKLETAENQTLQADRLPVADATSRAVRAYGDFT